jgi:hypothetical protein
MGTLLLQIRGRLLPFGFLPVTGTTQGSLDEIA